MVTINVTLVHNEVAHFSYATNLNNTQSDIHDFLSSSTTKSVKKSLFDYNLLKALILEEKLYVMKQLLIMGQIFLQDPVDFLDFSSD